MNNELKKAYRKLIDKILEEKRIIFTDEELSNLGIEVSIEEQKPFLHYSPSLSENDPMYFIFYVAPEEVSEKIMEFLNTQIEVGDSSIYDPLLNEFLLNYIYDEHAGGTEYGDPLAWLVEKIAEEFNIEPDEKKEYYETNLYVGAKRYGDKWVVVVSNICNYTRKYTMHGVFSCTTYGVYDSLEDAVDDELLRPDILEYWRKQEQKTPA